MLCMCMLLESRLICSMKVHGRAGDKIWSVSLMACHVASQDMQSITYHIWARKWYACWSYIHLPRRLLEAG